MNLRPLMAHLSDLLQQVHSRSSRGLWVGANEAPIVSKRLGRPLEPHELVIKKDDELYLMTITPLGSINADRPQPEVDNGTASNRSV